MARSFAVLLAAAVCAMTVAVPPATSSAASSAASSADSLAGPPDGGRGPTSHVRAPRAAGGAGARTPAGARDTVAPRRWADLPASSGRAVPSRVRVLVMRIHWSGKPPAFPSTGTMRAMMKETAQWYAHASRGRHHLSSKVTPWLGVPGGAGNCASLGGSLHNAVAAAKRRGIGVGGFNRFMVVMPQCATNSQGELPGRVTWIREPKPYVAVLVHELGHNLGLDHANSLVCSADNRRVPLGGKCQGQEYGDMWDAMGLSSQQFSVAILQRLGWAGKVATASRSGSWTLRDAASSGNGLQGLRVRSGAASYWLEYRTDPHALDDSPGTFPITGEPGLQVRLDTGARSLQILDAAPGNPDPHLLFPDPDLVSAALPVGSSITTPQKVRITLVSQDATSARVRITRSKAASAPAAPGLVSAVRRPDYGDVQLTIAPPPTDNGQVVLGYLAQRSPGGKAVYVADPGSADTTLEVADSHQGAGTWSIRAVNQVGTSPASPQAVEHVPAPTVTITSPAPGAAVHGPAVTVAVDASPDALTHAAVSSVTVCLEVSGECGTDTTAPYSVTLTNALSGAEKVRATAVDTQGGQGASGLVPITVVDSPPTVHLDAPADGTVVIAGDAFTVAATATPDPTTLRPVTGVSFTAYPVGSPDIVATDFDGTAPYAGELSLFDPGDYRIEAVATDDLYSSSPSSVTIHVVAPATGARPHGGLRAGVGDRLGLLG